MEIFAFATVQNLRTQNLLWIICDPTKINVCKISDPTPNEKSKGCLKYLKCIYIAVLSRCRHFCNYTVVERDEVVTLLRVLYLGQFRHFGLIVSISALLAYLDKFGHFGKYFCQFQHFEHICANLGIYGIFVPILAFWTYLKSSLAFWQCFCQFGHF